MRAYSPVPPSSAFGGPNVALRVVRKVVMGRCWAVSRGGPPALRPDDGGRFRNADGRAAPGIAVVVRC